MKKISTIKNYAFCLNKLIEARKEIKTSINDIRKFKINKPGEKFYDSLINNDIKIKKYNKILTKIKQETIKELIYTNKQIPLLWKKELGYNNFIYKLMSKDEKFLMYLGHSSEKENINNRNKNNRPKTGIFPSYCKNNILSKNSFFNRNKSISRNKNNSFKLIGESQKFIRSKSLNNIVKSRNYFCNNKSMNKITDSKNENIKEEISKNSIKLFSSNKTCTDLSKKYRLNFNKKSPENINKIDKNLIKQRLFNSRNNKYSNIFSPISKSISKRIRSIIKNNSCTNIL